MLPTRAKWPARLIVALELRLMADATDLVEFCRSSAKNLLGYDIRPP